MVLVILALSPIAVFTESLTIRFEYHEISGVIRVHIDSRYIYSKKRCDTKGYSKKRCDTKGLCVTLGITEQPGPIIRLQRRTEQARKRQSRYIDLFSPSCPLD